MCLKFNLTVTLYIKEPKSCEHKIEELLSQFRDNLLLIKILYINVY